MKKVLVLISLMVIWTTVLSPNAMCQDKPNIPDLIKQLGDDDFKVREAATEKLIKIGEPALEPVRKAFKETKDPEVRMRAKRIINEIETSLRIKNLPKIWGKEVWYHVKMGSKNRGYFCYQTSEDKYKGEEVLKFIDYLYLTMIEWEPYAEMKITTFCRKDKNLTLLYSKCEKKNKVLWELEVKKDKVIHSYGGKKEEIPISEIPHLITFTTLHRLITILPFEKTNLNIKMLEPDSAYHPVDFAIGFEGKEEISIGGTKTTAYKFSADYPAHPQNRVNAWLNEKHQILKMEEFQGRMEIVPTSKEAAEKGIAQLKKQQAEKEK